MKRNGYAASGAAGMDDMTYNYANATQNNQLTSVTDAVASANYTTDIDNQTSSANYTYDAIGNLMGDAAEGITNIDWTVYRKIHKIYKATYNLEFSYNASGERVEKIMKPVVSGVEKTQEYWTYTYYVRDAQGNVLSVYDRQLAVDGPAITDHLNLQESPIYGSSRLGLVMEDPERNSITPGATAHLDGYNADGTMIRSSIMALAAASAYAPHNTMGNKRYELGNHLGNVNVVISDRKLAVDDGSYNASGITDFYIPEVVSSQDYYSFGAEMPGRSFSSDGYRYGFNGKENDVKGVTGSQQDYGMRIYDPRLGKFLSVDPLTKNYPFYTPYAFAGNNPIEFVDLDGAEQKKPSVLYGQGVMTMAVDETAGAYTTEQIKNMISPVKPAVPKPVSKPTPVISATDMSPGAVESRERAGVQNWVNNSKKQISGTFEGGGGDFGLGSNQTLQDAVKATPGVVIPEMAAGYLFTNAAIVTEVGAENLFSVSNISNVARHLEQFGSCAENDVMLARMAKISEGTLEATETDINFMSHEMREAELMEGGMKYEQAHNTVLEEQGMGGEVDYQKLVYTKEALEAGDAAEAAKYGIK